MGIESFQMKLLNEHVYTSKKRLQAFKCVFRPENGF